MKTNFIQHLPIFSYKIPNIFSILLQIFLENFFEISANMYMSFTWNLHKISSRSLLKTFSEKIFKIFSDTTDRFEISFNFNQNCNKISKQFGTNVCKI